MAGTPLRPVDLFSLGYLGIGAVLMLLFPHRVPDALPLAVAHLVGMFALVAARLGGLERFRAGRFPLGRVLLDFYPLVLFGLLYSEVGGLNRALHPVGFFDADILDVEQFLFHSQPARDLHAWLPFRPLGEYLHLCYFSYYALVPLLALLLWFRRSRAAFEIAIGVVSLSFYVSFLFFIAFPVAGPYYVFPHPDPESVGYVMPRIVRWVLNHGSSVGAAFPSSHVAVSTTTWIMAMRYHRRLAVVYAFLVPGLALGAIYGGYHYATDALAGAVLALILGTAGWRATRALRRELLGGEPAGATGAGSQPAS